MDLRTRARKVPAFDSLTFQISREGVMVVNQTFLTVVDAVSFLDGEVLNLGSNGVWNVSGNLDLMFNVSLTTNDVGAGFYFDLVFGNSTIDAGHRRTTTTWTAS